MTTAGKKSHEDRMPERKGKLPQNSAATPSKQEISSV